jgi:hypothetical protein
MIIQVQLMVNPFARVSTISNRNDRNELSRKNVLADDAGTCVS